MDTRISQLRARYLSVPEVLMIRECTLHDFVEIYQIINDAAQAYRDVIPEDRWQHPYMPAEELREEMKRVTFYGWEEGGRLVGVMGIEPMPDVTLIRHAYVLTEHQQRGIGSQLVRHLIDLADTDRLLVGTWADAVWALDFYEKHGFELVPNKDKLLRRYWDVPDRQIETSVVLGIEFPREA